MTIFSTIFNAVSPVSSSILKPVAIGGAVIVVVGGFYAYAQERQKTADDAKYQAIIYQQEIINAKKEGVQHDEYENAKTQLQQNIAALADNNDLLNAYADSLLQTATSADKASSGGNTAGNNRCSQTKRRALSEAIAELSDCTATELNIWNLWQSDRKVCK